MKFIINFIQYSFFLKEFEFLKLIKRSSNDINDHKKNNKIIKEGQLTNQ